jgi:E3 ubiquitin-protein ligase listerin
VAGFGFGAPAAAAAADPTSAAAAGADGEPALPPALDGDVAQCLRHLSKKDATTKLKALASLRELAAARPAADAAAALTPWGYHFRRLMMDPSKSVRAEACATMGALAAAVGKALAPHLRALLPPWWLAAFDPYADVAAAARRTLAEAFPGPKQAAALAFCRWGPGRET